MVEIFSVFRVAFKYCRFVMINAVVSIFRGAVDLTRNFNVMIDVVPANEVFVPSTETIDSRIVEPLIS